MFQFMFRIERSRSFYLIALAALLPILSTGCGSNSSTNNNLSQAQAQAVAQQVSQALTQALGAAVPATATAPATDAHPSLSTVVNDLHPDALPGCTSSSNGETCNIPISLTNYPCSGSQGGTISVTGDVDGTLTNTGSGSLSAQLAITPANCSVSNLILNGDPSINVAGQINFTNNETPVFPVTFTETGGISYGPNPSGSCQVNATYTINSSLSCTISGTVCGQSVSGSC
ncbi:MAG: hypothetical protein ABSF72_09085 [Candidatus Sulfotelmatobacter sp.]|jgi:hypothetical protein